MDEEYDASWPEVEKEEKLEQSLNEIDLFEDTDVEVEVDNYGVPGGHNSIPYFFD
ncbi:MAG: hypothetical protein M1416_02720 [Candidatus Pacearchaeota archaeon]|nr:hypothetical protein [Candidatus Pacearchaeota archaeon]